MPLNRHYLGDKISKNEVDGEYSTYEREETLYRVLVKALEGKRSFGRPGRSWENNIKVELQEVGCGVMDWIDLAHDMCRWQALVNEAMNLQVQ